MKVTDQQITFQYEQILARIRELQEEGLPVAPHLLSITPASLRLVGTGPGKPPSFSWLQKVEPIIYLAVHLQISAKLTASQLKCSRQYISKVTKDFNEWVNTLPARTSR